MMALDLNNPNVVYDGNKVIIKALPQKGENLSVFVRPGDEVIFDLEGIDPDKLEYLLIGGDIVVSFPGEGALTFASLGLMGFSGNPPIFRYPGGKFVSIDDILSKIEEVNDLPIESVNASFKVRVSDVEEETGLMNNEQDTSSQPIIIIPQTQINENEDTPEQNFVAMYNEQSAQISSSETLEEETSSSTSISSITSAGISDVSDAAQASLSFSLGFYQTNYETNDSATEVLGGGGSELANISTSASAQIQPETIDLSDDYNSVEIYADNPEYFGDDGEYVTRVVRITPEQPEGFGVTQIDISGLPDEFEIIGTSGTSLTEDNGFSIVEIDGVSAVEFLIKYPADTDFDTFAVTVTVTSEFSVDNLDPGTVIETPDLFTLIEENVFYIEVKETITASDYVYSSQNGEDGYVLNSNLNSNIIYTSQGDSTVHGGSTTDTIYGQAGDDTIYGNSGNDTLSGGSGANTIDGGDGSDTLNYDFVERLSALEAIEIKDYISDDEFEQIITVINDGVTINLEDGTASGITLNEDYYTAITTTAPSSGVADYDSLMPTFNDTFTNIENISATNYDDTVYGDSNDNTLSGLSGDDSLYGNAGDDKLSGGDGDDYLEAGTDSEVGTNLDSLIDMSDLSNPNIGIVDLYTNFGDIIDGGAGEDTIGFEDIVNTAGTDEGVRVFLDTSDDGESNEAGIAYGASTAMGVDLIMNIENVIGSNYDDILVGNDSDNTLQGLGGDDSVVGIGGTNYLYGYKDGFSVSEIIDMIDDGTITSEYYIVDGDTTYVRVNNDSDVLAISTNSYKLYSGAVIATSDTTFTYDLDSVSSDKITKLTSSSVLNADSNDVFYEDGDDYLLGGSGDDYLYGNEGDDTLNGSLGNNYIDGGSGTDTVQFSDSSLDRVVVDLETSTGKKYSSADVLLGTDTLANIEIVEGTTGDDTLLGNDENNTLYGGEGDDTLAGRGGENYLDGGEGDNWITFSDSEDSATVDLSTNSATVDGVTSEVYNIDNIIGSNIADTLSGNENSNTILGGRGDDTISGSDGNNVLDGGDGTNTLDYSFYTNSIDTAGLDIDMSESYVNHDAYVDSISNFQNLIGTDYDDTLTGNEENNTVFAGMGDDTLVASLGNDVLKGQGGDDTADYSNITSGVIINLKSGSAQGAGTDTLESIENAIGGTGNDTLIGSDSSNTLIGGLGDDTLQGNLGSNTLDGGLGTNTVDYSWTTTGVDVALGDSPSYGTATGTSIDDTLINIDNIIGGSGNDTLYGNSEDNIIWGTSGSNTLSGGSGTNTLYGGTGNDIFIGGSGSDNMVGGGGSDTLTYENITSTVSVNLGENKATGADIATDTITSINTVIGGSGDDTLIGNSSNNSLDGGEGSDTLYGGRGNNTLDGGEDSEGNDRDIVDYSEFSDRVVVNLSDTDYTDTTTGTTVFAGTTQRFGVYEGVDTLIDIEDIYGSSLDDTLIGNTSNNIIYGSAGRDVIKSIGGSNSLYGGEDNDTFLAGAGSDVIDGGSGYDILDFSDFSATSGVTFSLQEAGNRSSAFNNDTQQTVGGGFGTFQVTNVEKIIGTAQNDILEGKDSFSDTIAAGSGDDTVYATSGNDIYDGETGLNTLDYSNYSGAIDADLSAGEINGVATGYDQVSNFTHLVGSTGDDTILGDSNDNILDGSAGDDVIDGVSGDNILIAGAGIDTLVAREGSDTYDGSGAGDDTVDYSNLSTAIDIVLNSAGDATINSGYTHTLTEIEHIIGTTGNDTITGDSTSVNTINGYSGNDILQGGTGSADVLYGGSGNDTFLASSGGDSIYGGDGTDTLDYSDITGTAGVYLDLSQSAIYSDGFASVEASIESIEIIEGSASNDTIYGTSTDNIFYGNAGDDTLEGREGSDTLYGVAGNNTLDGGLGNDTLYAGTGNDKLLGGAGADTLDARDNGGDNTFIGGLGDDIYYGGAGIDTLDYTSSESAITVSSDNTITSILEGVTDTDTLLTSFEVLEATNYADTIDLDGDLAGGTIYANGGNDIIYASTAGNDTIYGGNADDTIYANGGNNVYYGGSETSGNGDDTLDYSLATSGVDIDLSSNIASINGFGGSDAIYDINTIIATDEDDTIAGNSENNTISTGTGDDTLYLSTGQDVLDGGTNTNGDTENDWLSLQNMSTPVSSVNLSNNNAGDSKVYNIENVIDYNGDRAQTVWGSSSDNIFVMYGGNDYVIGYGGDDTYDMGLGNDYIYANNGSDIIIGGSGTDNLNYNDNVGENQASTIILQDVSIDTDNDGVGDISVFATVVEKTVSDLASLSDGTYDFFAITDGQGNTDYIYKEDDGTADIESFTLTDYADLFVGDEGANTVSGRNGADTIYGMGGADTINSGDGDDLVYGGEGSDNINGGNGADLIHGEADDDIINGYSGNDSLYGDAGDDTINGGENNDTILGGIGNDSLNGDGGIDIIYDEEGIDTIDGGDSEDTVIFVDGTQGIEVDLENQTSIDAFGNSQTITNVENITGTSDSDTIKGSDGIANIMYGLGGDDTFTITTNEVGKLDYIYGGEGDDTVILKDDVDGTVGDTNANLLVSPEEDTNYDNSVDMLEHDILTFESSGVSHSTIIDGIENIEGSAKDDYIQGNSSTNVINTGAGNDYVQGLGGADTIDLGAGDDIVEGGAGNDTLTGGEGSDTLVYSSSTTAVTVNLTTSVSTGTDIGTDTISGFENIVASNSADTLTGDDGANIIYGLSGADTIDGMGDADTIYAGEGDDIVDGGSGADTIYAGDGDDTITASIGGDTIDGGDDSDIVDYSASTTGLSVTLEDDGATTTIISSLGSDSVSHVEGIIGSLTQSNTLSGNNLNNILTGGNLSDELHAISADNTLYGGAGDDTLYAGTGSDALLGGTGTNTLNYTEVGTVDVNVNLRTEIATYSNGSTDTFSDIDNLVMGEGNDTVQGDQFANTLDGGNGADTLSFSGATSSVILNVTSDGVGTASGDGSDSFSNFENYTLSSYADTLNVYNVYGSTIDGGNNTDTASYANASSNLAVTIDNGNTSATVSDGTKTDTLQSFEEIIGGSGNDTFTVSDVDSISTLDGGSGVNTLELSGSLDLSNVEILNFDTIIIPDNEVLTLDATQIDGETLTFVLQGSGSLIIDATNLASDHDFDNISIDKSSADTEASVTLHVESSVDLSLQNLNDIFDVFDVANGTLTVSEIQAIGTIISGSGSAIVEVSTDSATDFDSVLVLDTPANETIQFTADSTFGGDFGDSNIVVDSGVTLTTTSDKLHGKTSALTAEGNIILTDAAATDIAATDLSAIGGATSGTVTVTNAVDINGTIAEATAALITADTKVNASTATVTLSDTGSVSAKALTDLDATTSGVITVATGVTTLTGTIAEVQAAFDANDAGTITGLDDTEEAIVSDTGSIVATTITNLAAETSGNITVNSGVTELTGTIAQVQAVYDAANVIIDKDEAVTVSDAGSVTATVLNNLNDDTSGLITAASITTVTGTTAAAKLVTDALGTSGNAINLGTMTSGDTNAAFTITDAAATDIAATDLSAIGGATSGTVTVTNAVDINGTIAEATAALITADTKVNASTATVTLSDTGSVSAKALTDLDATTSGVIDGTSITGIIGTLSQLISLNTAINAGTIDIGDDVAIEITDADDESLAASDLSTIGSSTTGTVTVNNAVNISGTQTAVVAALITASSLVVAASANVEITDSASVTNVNSIDALTTGEITASITDSVDNLKTLTGEHAYTITISDTAATTTELNTINNATSETVTLSSTGDFTVTMDTTTLDLSTFTNSVSGDLIINDTTGNDTITGTLGDDIVYLSLGDDSVTLGDGDDTVNISADNLTSADTIVGGEGTDTLNITSNASDFTTSDFTNVSGIENLNFSDSSDGMTFTDSSDFTDWKAKFTSVDFGDSNDDTINFDSTSISGDLDFSNVADIENLNLSSGSDNITLSGDEATNINGLGNDDTFTLNFSNISNFTIDSGSGSDTLSLTVSDGNTLSGSFTNFEVLNLTGSGTVEIDDTTIDSWSSNSDSLTLQYEGNSTYNYSTDGGINWTNGTLTLDDTTSGNHYIVSVDTTYSATDDLTLHVI
jgi:Ca2+-binding RTX toxin-like protein